MRLRNTDPNTQDIPEVGLWRPGEIREVTDEQAQMILAPGRPFEIADEPDSPHADRTKKPPPAALGERQDAPG